MGRRVVHILGKRRGDLTEDDARVMRRVVERVRAQRRDSSPSRPPATPPGTTS